MTSAIAVIAVLGATPVHLAVTLDYTLVRPPEREPKTMQKRWYVEVPAKRADKASMEELLHRVFFDTNVQMRMNEPGDTSYLSMVSFTTERVDTAKVAAWQREKDGPLPWLVAQGQVVWEPGACFVVDDKGRYDTIDADDFTELVLNRLLEARAVTEERFKAFFQAYFPHAKPQAVEAMFASRAKRMKNITEIRTGPYRKAPGSKPYASGPVDAVVQKLISAPTK